MCGIAGILGEGGDSLSEVKKMMASIAYRGPDEAGLFYSESATMGNVRLSVLDIESGSQPICDESKRFWIVYNGEVYNYLEIKEQLKSLDHTFVSDSDTEVVLRSWIEWGPECLSRFNGAFAFAIYDKLEKVAFIARDRFGKRPLFYLQKKSRFAFASEAKCFLGLNGFSTELNTETLSSNFSFWVPIDGETVFKGVNQLPAGHFGKISLNSPPVIRPYFQLDFSDSEEIQDRDYAIELTKRALENAVKIRLRSDVEVGTYLSGGLDSAITTELAAKRVSRRLRTFSVTFKDKKFDESDSQVQLSKFYGTEHSSLMISDKDIVDNFDKALWHGETPVFRTAFVPLFLLSRMVRDAGVKVVLTGEGADEQFLGYNIFKETFIRENLKSEEESGGNIHSLYPYLNHFNAENQRVLLSTFKRFSDQKGHPLFSHLLRFHSNSLAKRMLTGSSDSMNLLLGQIEEQAGGFRGWLGLRKAQWLEFKTLLSGYLLSTQGDRMSLAHGVEGRCPFLDPEVYRVAKSLSLNHLLKDGKEEKWILKEAFGDRVPEFLLTKPKQPYLAPGSGPFLNERPDYLDTLFSQSERKKLDFLNHNLVDKFLKKIEKTERARISPKEDHAFLLLLSSAIIHSQFVEGKAVITGDIESILTKQICLDGGG